MERHRGRLHRLGRCTRYSTTTEGTCSLAVDTCSGSRAGAASSRVSVGAGRETGGTNQHTARAVQYVQDRGGTYIDQCRVRMFSSLGIDNI